MGNLFILNIILDRFSNVNKGFEKKAGDAIYIARSRYLSVDPIGR